MPIFSIWESSESEKEVSWGYADGNFSSPKCLICFWASFSTIHSVLKKIGVKKSVFLDADYFQEK
jgi:hypothetical protein